MIELKIDKYEKIAKGKYRLYLSNGEVIDIYDDVIISNDLLLKKEIDRNLYDKILIDNNIQEVYNSCVRYITIRIRCIKEIRDYLLRKNVNEVDIAFIIDKLINNKLVDDSKFCECYIKDKFKFTSWGPHKIIRNLNNYDISDNIINNFSYLFDDEIVYDKLRKLILKSIGTNHKLDNNKLKNKLYKYFFSLGYSSEMILNVLNEVL